MGAHMNPECKMPPEIVPVVCLENIKLTGTFFSAFAKITSACYSEFPEIFIARIRKFFRNGVCRLKTSDRRHNIDDRFGGQSRNGCAPDMVEGNAIIFQNFGNTIPFFCIFQRPFWVIIHDGNMLRHFLSPLCQALADFFGLCRAIIQKTPPTACETFAVGGIALVSFETEKCLDVVEATRFELTTSWSRTKRATKLRYASILFIITDKRGFCKRFYLVFLMLARFVFRNLRILFPKADKCKRKFTICLFFLQLRDEIVREKIQLRDKMIAETKQDLKIERRK